MLMSLAGCTETSTEVISIEALVDFAVTSAFHLPSYDVILDCLVVWKYEIVWILYMTCLCSYCLIWSLHVTAVEVFGSSACLRQVSWLQLWGGQGRAAKRQEVARHGLTGLELRVFMEIKRLKQQKSKHIMMIKNFKANESTAHDRRNGLRNAADVI